MLILISTGILAMELVPGGGFGTNVVIFGVDMSSSIHVDNKKGHFNSWERSNTRIRTYTDCRKNAFN